MASPEDLFLTPVRNFGGNLSGLSGGKHHAPVAQSVRGTRLKIVPVSVQVRPGVPAGSGFSGVFPALPWQNSGLTRYI